MNIYHDRVSVITGAGSGIGRALSVRLAARGARLALSDINASDLEETRQLCMQAGAMEVRPYLVDVSQRDAVFGHAADVKRDFGTAHFLVNNAGATIFGTVEHTTIEEFEWQIGVNLWGVIYGIKAFLPMMLAQREGCIVNISSVFGLVGAPVQGAYNVSKFGVRGLTECLWSELRGTGVRAVSVHPGGIRTNIEKMGRRCAAADQMEADFLVHTDRFLVTPAEKCAADIIRGVERGRARILTGRHSSLLSWLSRLLPARYPSVLVRLAK